MSIDIIFVVIAIVVMGLLLYALTPRGLDQSEDAIGLPFGGERPYGSGKKGR